MAHALLTEKDEGHHSMDVGGGGAVPGISDIRNRTCQRRRMPFSPRSRSSRQRHGLRPKRRRRWLVKLLKIFGLQGKLNPTSPTFRVGVDTVLGNWIRKSLRNITGFQTLFPQ